MEKRYQSVHVYVISFADIQIKQSKKRVEAQENQFKKMKFFLFFLSHTYMHIPS